MDPTEDLGLHPRLAQAHADFHGSHAYRQVIQMVDSGSIAAAIPPVYRSSLKTMIEQLLVQFHDLGLAAGLRGESDPLQALQEAETKQAQILRQRLEGALGR
ncbi:MAG TPA: hypothetical protein VEI97_11030, partial [bacterium]|nr:hypothetical protein [bacterium]